MRGEALLCMVVVPAGSSAAPDGYFDLQPGVTLETADAWLGEGVSCLRGAANTDKAGEKRDCGGASLLLLAAYIGDIYPVCAPVAKSTSITCCATVGPARLDPATMLIGSGFAFATLDADGMPFHSHNPVIEDAARENQAGLWQFNLVQHPVILLSVMANEPVREAGQ
jgi:hypothetical protein